ncbi:KAP family P-loop NTPase fold protein [Burkholderia sp. WSM2232]|uniref:KAP family P-loop NTPase fold protein n=1 Tax=Burkholderia sp. WSM2232 TaxID=944436 RepID=UPI000A0220A7
MPLNSKAFPRISSPPLDQTMRPPPTLLTDEPSPHDELGGAHAKIADTIVTLVRTSPGGQTVRLDGTWGSGKSSVVKMIAQRLEPFEPNTTANGLPASLDVSVFQYDAWVHSGDPLRRAFLAALVGKLQGRGWLEKTGGAGSREFWTTRLAELSRRLKVTTKKTKPVFSPSAKTILAGLAAIGIAAPMLADFERKLLDGAGLMKTAVFGLVTAAVAFRLLRSLTDETVGFIIRRTSDEETIETREEPDPTSVEFQEAFGQLMEAVLSDESRRLLVVVDNLDRINESETQAVWALLRSFLDNPDFTERQWFRRLWVIVPVADKKRVLASSVSNLMNRPVDNDSHLSFFEKVFQLQFSVPPPMLHSWKNYLNSKLVKTFGEDLTGDYDEILRLYEELRPQGTLTPRGIISFVNELVILKLEWADDVSLSCLAAYLLSRDSLSDLNCSPPAGVTNVLREPGLGDTFAMLYHRATSRGEASYLSVRPRLEQALDNADADELMRLYSESPAFEHVLDRYIRQDLSGLDSQQERLLQAVRALAPLAGPDSTIKLPAGRIAHLRHVVFTTFVAGKTLRLLNLNLASGLTALFALVQDRTALASAVIEMLRNINRANQSADTGLSKQIAAEWDAWTSILVAVLSLTDLRGVAEADGFEPIALPIEPKAWAQLCLQLADSDDEWILRCCTSNGGTELQLAWLSNEISSHPPMPLESALLMHRMKMGDEQYFGTAADAFVRRCSDKSLSAFNADDVEYLVQTGSALLRIGRARMRSPLRQLMSKNVLLHVYAKAGSIARNDMVLATLYYFIAYASDAQPVVTAAGRTDMGDAATGLDRFNKSAQGGLGLNSEQGVLYADVLVDLGLYDVLKLLGERYGHRGIVASVVAGLADSEKFIGYLNEQVSPREAVEAFAEMYIFDALRGQFVSRLLNRLEHARATSPEVVHP